MSERRTRQDVLLLLVKLLHTLVWAFFAALILYVLQAGLRGRIGPSVYLAIGLILLEVMVLLVCAWRCPLTLLAARWSEDTQVGFDIFLPRWLARHNKTLFGFLFGVGTVLVAVRTWMQ